ncbi:MAG: peptidoglycan-associated lipoprotein Pal [Candidatus Binatia bacterium]
MAGGWLKNSASTGLAVLVGLLLVLPGCSAKRGGMFGGWGGSSKHKAEVSAEQLAAEPSIAQFEEVGTVAAGGPLEDVSFAFDSVQVGPGAQAALESNAAWMATHPQSRVEVEGHCDERGTSEYNLALGERRARAVVEALVSMGVDSGRLSTVSYGEELPLCKESNEECWERNRRAHLVDLGG